MNNARTSATAKPVLVPLHALSTCAESETALAHDVATLADALAILEPRTKRDSRSGRNAVALVAKLQAAQAPMGYVPAAKTPKAPKAPKVVAPAVDPHAGSISGASIAKITARSDAAKLVALLGSEDLAVARAAARKILFAS